MAVIGKLAADPRWATGAMIDHRTQLRLSFRPEILALWMHFALASIAVAAIAALWPARRPTTPGAAEPDQPADGAARGLAALALGASALQIPIGVWLLAASSTRTREALLGNDAAASACFLGGLVAAFVLLQSLAAIVMGEVAPPLRRRAAWLLAIVAVLMAATLSLGRAADAHDAKSDAQLAPDERDHSAFFSGSLLASSIVPPGNVPALIRSS
jgi:hypothetical protein